MSSFFDLLPKPRYQFGRANERIQICWEREGKMRRHVVSETGKQDAKTFSSRNEASYSSFSLQDFLFPHQRVSSTPSFQKYSVSVSFHL